MPFTDEDKNLREIELQFRSSY